MQFILILGAKSDIAQPLAKIYAKKGYHLYLAARNCQELEPFAHNLQIRYKIKAQCLELDILDYAKHKDFYFKLPTKIVGVISAIGYLGNQQEAQSNIAETQKIIHTNYTGIVYLLNIIADDFEKRKNGFIVGISSVAGERGRKSNYIYGSAKAAFSTYLSGLRNRLDAYNVAVLTVLPGFVATRMTKDLALPPRLTASPQQVAGEIYQAQQKRQNVLYTKALWKWIMRIIRNIPESKFKKMSI